MTPNKPISRKYTPTLEYNIFYGRNQIDQEQTIRPTCANHRFYRALGSVYEPALINIRVRISTRSNPPRSPTQNGLKNNVFIEKQQATTTNLFLVLV